MKKLTIRLGNVEDAFDQLREVVRTRQPAGSVISFATYDDFAKTFTGNRMRLIKTLINAEKGMTVRELAAQLGRNVRGVHDDIKALEWCDLLVNERGNIHVAYDDLHIDVHITKAA